MKARIALAARLAAGVVLTAGGFLKLRTPAEEFAAALEAYRLLPAAWLLPLARAVPWAEYLTGVYLLAGLWLSLSAPAGLFLFGSFIVSLASVFVRGIPLDSCGCFGAMHLPPSATLSMDVVLAAGLFVVLRDREKLFSVDRSCAGEKYAERPKPGASRPRA